MAKMNRKYVPYHLAGRVAGYEQFDAEMLGVLTPTQCIDWENMGWCKDGVTRWYHFTAEDGTPCYTLKH